MQIIEKYFKEKANNVSFLELKENSNFKISSQIIDNNIPLPIITETLVKGIKEKTISEEIQISHIIDGMIYILGVDPNFKYNGNYISILEIYNPKIENYIFFKGIKYLSKENYDDAIVYFKTIKTINRSNVDGIFNYGICLEGKAKEYFEAGRNKEGEAFLKEATNSFESILDIDSDYYLAYYKLGYHYKNSAQYLKATLIWEKYLLLEPNDDRKQEIREQLELINNDSLYEEACNLFYSNRYEQALDKFLKVESKVDNWWNLKYMIGLTYKELGDLESAIKYLYEAIELNTEVVDIYNELGICLYALGSFKEAMEIFNIGIEKNSNDYKIIFNRGIAYYQMGLYEKSEIDFEMAYSLNPNDPVVKKFKEKLDSINEF